MLFEPHRYTRTKECFSDFSNAFDDADKVFISKIYSAGENPIEGIDSKSLTDSLNHNFANYTPEFINELDDIWSQVSSGDIVVTLGAGSISKFTDVLAKKISAKKISAEKMSVEKISACLLYTSPSPRDQRGSRMPSSA